MSYHTIHLLLNKKLDKIEELYLNTSIRTFALSMINVFIPIYLLKLGYPLSSVLFFYAILNGVHALSVIPAAKISARFGFKHAILFSLVFVFIIGRFSDIKRELVLKVGALFNAIIWGIKTIITTSFQVFIIDSFYGMTKTMISIPFDASSYDKANKSNVVEFIMFREIVIQIGRVTLFILMLLVSNLMIGFLFSGSASLFYLFF